MNRQTQAALQAPVKVSSSVPRLMRCKSCNHEMAHYRTDVEWTHRAQYVLRWSRCPMCFSVELERWEAVDPSSEWPLATTGPR